MKQFVSFLGLNADGLIQPSEGCELGHIIERRPRTGVTEPFADRQGPARMTFEV
jgi:hypothetical protein